MRARPSGWSRTFCSWLVYHDAAPVPSPLDACYLAFYPTCYAAIVMLARNDVRGMLSSLRLDGLIAALAVAAFVSEFAIHPITDTVGGTVAEVATNLAYPVGDLLLVLLVVGVLALRRWRVNRRWALLGAGLALTAAADTGYLLESAAGTYRTNGPLDLLWPLGLLLVASAAWQPAAPQVRSSFEGLRAIVLPNLFMLSSIGFLALGDRRPEQMPGIALAGGAALVGAIRIGATFREVSALAEARRQAVTDELTGLVNRRGLGLALRTALDRAEAGGAEGALLLLDLDRFKELNDTLGHYAGDALLQQVAERVEAALRPGDVLGRLGGDEFAVVAQAPCVPEQVAERVLGALDESFLVDEVQVHVDGSVGIARFPVPAGNAEELLRRADVALYQAKAARDGHVQYEPERDARNLEGLALLGELREAIRREELVLHYQPRVAIGSGRMVGVEALVRWDHPERGLLLPAAFIPLTEQTALARPLTVYVLRRALQQLRAWLGQGADLCMSVNVSTANLLDESFPEAVSQLLRETRAPADRLILEVTENAILLDPRRASTVLDRLRTLGVRVSLDDFGTGFSSISHLKQLPVSELKIDRSFVTNIVSDPSDEQIVRSIIELGRRLKMDVVAEGVESAEALARLEALGCELAQGYHLGLPQVAEAFVGLLETDWPAAA